MKVFIYPNLSKPNALMCIDKVVRALSFKGISICIDKKCKDRLVFDDFLKFIDAGQLDESFDFVIAIGGDGTILECAKIIMKYDLKLIGINTGRLGFMSSLEFEEIDNIKLIESGKYAISKRMTIQGSISSGINVCALNDIVIYEQTSKMIEFEVYQNDLIVGKYHANGVIFSTPTGSTAYALSAGGPIISPDMSCIEMTLICPHSLFARPVVFSADKKISLILKIREKQKVFLTADGEKDFQVTNNDKIIIQKSNKFVSMVDFGFNTFFDSLDKKFMHPIK